MSIEKIDQSIYFHPEISHAHNNILKALASLLDENECIIFYRPSGPIRATQDKKEKVVASTGGIEGDITQVTVFQDKIEKNLVSFYGSKDQSRFALFHGTEVFKNFMETSLYVAENFLRQEKTKKAYNLINLLEKKPIQTTKHLASESLEEIVKNINISSSLNDFVVRKTIFPTKFTKKQIEPVFFTPILKITAVSQLNLYCIKTREVFALIGEDELIALNRYRAQEKSKTVKEEPGALSSSTTKAMTSEATTITSGPFFPSAPQEKQSLKRKHGEVLNDSTNTDQVPSAKPLTEEEANAKQSTEEENPTKYVKTTHPTERCNV